MDECKDTWYPFTTRTEELVRVAGLSGIDETAFREAFKNISAEEAFRADLDLTRRLGFHSLPACVLQYGENAVMISALAGYEGFVSAIRELTAGEVQPAAPVFSEKTVEALIRRRELVSLLELREAFDQKEFSALNRILEKL